MLHTNAVVLGQFAIRLQDRVGSGLFFLLGAVCGDSFVEKPYPCEISSRLENKNYGISMI